MPQLLTTLIWLFSFWMVADSIRRRTGFLWVLLILWYRPWGGLVYLLILKLSEAKHGKQELGGSSNTPQTLASRVLGVGRLAGQTGDKSATPSEEPALDVADQLEYQSRYREAAAVYRKALVQKPSEPRALHGLARCLVELDEGEQALESFAALMELEPRFRDYSAALEYAEALHRCQRTGDAIGLLNGLVEETQRINHRLALAHYLVVEGHSERGCGVLREALQAYEGSSEADRIAVSHWHRRVVDMLEDLSVAQN